MKASVKFSLSDQELEKFKANGYIGPFELYKPDEITTQYKSLRKALFDRKFAPYDLDESSPIANLDRHLDIDFLSEHVCRPEIVGRVMSILGQNVLCWRSEFISKYPGDEGTDWHQADTFAHASGKPQIVWTGNEKFGGAITVWTAFTDASEELACLRFIPGTHEEMYYDESKRMSFNPESVNALEKDGVKRGFFGYDYRSLQKDSSWRPDESSAVSLEMKAGQFVIFWSTLMHASMPNTTEDRYRIGYGVRYVPTEVKVYPDTETLEEYGSVLSLDKYGVILVSGKDNYGFNKLVKKNLKDTPFKRYPV